MMEPVTPHAARKIAAKKRARRVREIMARKEPREEQKGPKSGTQRASTRWTSIAFSVEPNPLQDRRSDCPQTGADKAGDDAQRGFPAGRMVALDRLRQAPPGRFQERVTESSSRVARTRSKMTLSAPTKLLQRKVPEGTNDQ